MVAKMKKILTLVFMVTSCFVTSASAGIMTFTDLTSFQAAVLSGSTTQTDTFSNDIPQSQTIVFDSGVSSTNLDSIFFNDNSVSGGRYNNAIDTTPAQGATLITLDFGGPISAFGFDFFGVQDSGNTTNSTTVQVSINDGMTVQDFVLFDLAGVSSGFAGFVLDSPVSSASFSAFAPAGAGFDVFQLDNLVFADVPAGSVPVPATITLFGLGLAGLGWSRRKNT
jgi:hypothetical protein